MERAAAWIICVVLWVFVMFAAGWITLKYGAANVTVAFCVGSMFCWVAGYVGILVDRSFDKQKQTRRD